MEEEIRRKDLEDFQICSGGIVLLKTRNSTPGYVKFFENYVHLKMDVAEYLVDAGVKTLGFDYLRVSKHEGEEEVRELLINNMTLLQGSTVQVFKKGNICSLVYPFL
ncbi:MAG: arylformamidase [Euryarchaeota archaeon]|nr:arylformamidase [Euryarchaeota archaeon]